MRSFSIEQLLQTVPIAQIRQFKDNNVYALLEKFNLCGSIKVKPVYWMLKKALERGTLREGQKILEASIDELEHFGLPERSDKDNAIYTLIINSLEDELKGIQVKEIKSILMAAEKKETMLEDIKEKLKSYGPNVAATVLSSIMTDTLFIRELSK